MICLTVKYTYRIQASLSVFFFFFGTLTEFLLPHKLYLANDINSNLMLCFINQRGKYRIWNWETIVDPQFDNGLKILIQQFKHMTAILTFECLSNWCFIIGRAQQLGSKDLNYDHSFCFYTVGKIIIIPLPTQLIWELNEIIWTEVLCHP